MPANMSHSQKISEQMVDFKEITFHVAGMNCPSRPFTIQNFYMILILLRLIFAVTVVTVVSYLMKKQISIILITLVFAQTLLFQVDLPELVLCFGDDGHVAIEQASDSAHEHNEIQDISYMDVFQAFNSRHDDCTDIELDWHFSNADVTKVKNKIPLYNSTFLQFPFLQISENSFLNNNLVHTNYSKSTINSIRTTILLI